MWVFAFLVSIIVFFAIEFLISILFLSFYTIVVGFAQKKIYGYSDADSHSLNHFLGAAIGVLIASYTGYSLAIWIDAEVNLNILTWFFCGIYYFSTRNTEGAIKPWSQKIGAILGFSISYVFFNIL